MASKGDLLSFLATCSLIYCEKNVSRLHAAKLAWPFRPRLTAQPVPIFIDMHFFAFEFTHVCGALVPTDDRACGA